MRKQTGFTLFDITLAMVITSMIAVGAAKLVSSQAQSAADTVFGKNLFTYSQAAYLCAYNHTGTGAGLVGSGTFQTGTATAAIATAFWTAYGPAAQQNLTAVYPNSAQYTMGYSYTGTGWLSTCQDPNTGVTYLPNNFNIASNMDQLLVQTPTAANITSPPVAQQGNNSLTTYILYSPLTPSDPPLVFVVAGALYQADPKPNQYDLQPGLTGQAVNTANTLLGSVGSSNPFTYTYLRNSLGVTAPVFGYLSPGAVHLPSGGGPQFLLTEGFPAGNSMTGTLAIDTTASCTCNSGCPTTCVKPTITFPNNSGTITGINSLTIPPYTPDSTSPTAGFSLDGCCWSGHYQRSKNFEDRPFCLGSHGNKRAELHYLQWQQCYHTGSNPTIDMGSLPPGGSPHPFQWPEHHS